MVAAACGGKTNTTTATPPPATSAPAPSAAPTATAAAARADGRYFVELDSVDASKKEVRFDAAEFLTGDEAKQAAGSDGAEVDNDYYIRNTTKSFESLPVADDAEVKVVDWDHCCEMKDGDLAAVAAYFANGGRYDDDAGGSGPFFLTVRGGMVVKIEEQYLP